MDQGDAAAPRLERRGRGVRPIVELHRAAVGTQCAGHDAHQRTLAGAVLSDHGVHLAGAEHQVYAVQRHGRAEPLREVRDPEHAHCSLRYRAIGGFTSSWGAVEPGLAAVTSATPLSL